MHATAPGQPACRGAERCAEQCGCLSAGSCTTGAAIESWGSRFTARKAGSPEAIVRLCSWLTLVHVLFCSVMAAPAACGHIFAGSPEQPARALAACLTCSWRACACRPPQAPGIRPSPCVGSSSCMHSSLENRLCMGRRTCAVRRRALAGGPAEPPGTAAAAAQRGRAHPHSPGAAGGERPRQARAAQRAQHAQRSQQDGRILAGGLWGAPWFLP